MIINGVKKITNCRFLNLFSIQYKDQKDHEKEWIFASRSKYENPVENMSKQPDAVVIVPYHTDREELVLIKEFRVTLGGVQYGFPAGLVDMGESIEQAALRELFEETGLTVTRIIKKSPTVFSSSGLTDESISLVFVECTGEPTNFYNEASEEIEVVFVSQKAAYRMLSDDTIKFDVKTWIVLNTFALHGVV
ncbi:MAG: NUDIX hydrolase [Pseudomonadota bacterium]